MRALRTILVLCGSLVLLVLLGVGTYLSLQDRRAAHRQADLDAFYTAPPSLPTRAGGLIRTEPLTGTFDVPGATAYRMLYRTGGPHGEPRVSGGMVFIPTAPVPTGGRKIVSWAHPTVGMGDACAPSRSPTPTGLLDWLPAMVGQGWIVAADRLCGIGHRGRRGLPHRCLGGARRRQRRARGQADRRRPGLGRGTAGSGTRRVAIPPCRAGATATDYARRSWISWASPARHRQHRWRIWSRSCGTPTSPGSSAPRSSSPTRRCTRTCRSRAVGTNVATRVYPTLAQRCLLEGILDGTVREEVR